MKTATIRDLRNHYTTLIKWIEAGEIISITRLGKPLARLIPEKKASKQKSIDWRRSTVFLRNRAQEKCLTAHESASLLRENKGRW